MRARVWIPSAHVNSRAWRSHLQPQRWEEEETGGCWEPSGRSVPPIREHQVHWDLVFKNKTESVRIRSLASGLYTCAHRHAHLHTTPNTRGLHTYTYKTSLCPGLLSLFFPQGSKDILPTPTSKPLFHLGLPHTWAPHLN